jgi:hypothetical protein
VRTILSLIKGCLLLICLLGMVVGGLCGVIALNLGPGFARGILPVSVPIFVVSLVVAIGLRRAGGDDEQR